MNRRDFITLLGGQRQGGHSPRAHSSRESCQLSFVWIAPNGPDFANKRPDNASASGALIWTATGAASKLLGASG
jgi:hypothetical protein